MVSGIVRECGGECSVLQETLNDWTIVGCLVGFGLRDLGHAHGRFRACHSLVWGLLGGVRTVVWIVVTRFIGCGGGAGEQAAILVSTGGRFALLTGAPLCTDPLGAPGRPG